MQKGDDVPVDFCAEQVVSPVREGQPSVEFRLFRLSARLPPLDAHTPRTFVLVGDAAATQGSGHVPESAVAARLRVSLGGGTLASARATCKLYFGRTEVRAEAQSNMTGERQQVNILWSR